MSSGFLSRSDKNQAEQKMARGLKFWIKEVKRIVLSMWLNERRLSAEWIAPLKIKFTCQLSMF